MTPVQTSNFDAYLGMWELPQDSPQQSGEVVNTQETAANQPADPPSAPAQEDPFYQDVENFNTAAILGETAASVLDFVTTPQSFTSLFTTFAPGATEEAATAATEIFAGGVKIISGAEPIGIALQATKDVEQMVYQPTQAAISSVMTDLHYSPLSPAVGIGLPPSQVVSETDGAGNVGLADLSYVPATGNLASQISNDPIGSSIFDPNQNHTYVMGENGIVSVPGNLVPVADGYENPAAYLGIAGGPEGSLIGQPAGSHLPQTQTVINVNDTGYPAVPTESAPVTSTLVNTSESPPANASVTDVADPIPTEATPVPPPTDPLVYGGGGGGGGPSYDITDYGGDSYFDF
jgi:hypothetical protein